MAGGRLCLAPQGFLLGSVFRDLTLWNSMPAMALASFLWMENDLFPVAVL